MDLIDRKKLLSEISDEDSALAIYRKIVGSKSYGGIGMWIPACSEPCTLPAEDGRYLCAWLGDRGELNTGFLNYGTPVEYLVSRTPEFIFSVGDRSKAFGEELCGTGRLIKLIKPKYWMALPEVPGVIFEK